MLRLCAPCMQDPYLSGQYAINFVKGFQENPDAPGQTMASACCKHVCMPPDTCLEVYLLLTQVRQHNCRNVQYVANSMDGSTVDGHHATRVDFNAVISQQDLVDSYLPPFQACVEQGQVTSLMCSCESLSSSSLSAAAAAAAAALDCKGC
jgi:beta-D-xylosidase 4